MEAPNSLPIHEIQRSQQQTQLCHPPQTNDSFSEIATAIRAGDNATLSRLLKQNASSLDSLRSAIDSEGKNLAHLAADAPTNSAAIASARESLLLLADAFGPTYLTQRNESNGLTPVHVAAWKLNNQAMQFLLMTCGLSCFENSDDAKRTVAYFAAHNQDESTIIWMLYNLKLDIFRQPSSSGTTPLHACAGQLSVRVLEYAKERLGGMDDFKLPGYLKRSCVMYAAKNRRHPDALKWFVKQLGPGCLKERDEQFNTPVHLVAWFLDGESMRAMKMHLGDKCFSWRDEKGRVAIHCAAANESEIPQGGLSAFAWLLSDTTIQRLTLHLKDNEEQTCLHYCAANRSHGAQNFKIAIEAMPLESVNEAIKNSVDKNGRNPVFLACLLKNFDFLAADFVDLASQARADSSGNTLLHALFQTPRDFWNRKLNANQFFAEFERILSEGRIDLTAENSEKLNCLLATDIDSTSLKEILEFMVKQPLKYQKLLTNSEGLHAVHVFARRYSLSSLETVLSQLDNVVGDQSHQLKIFSVKVSANSSRQQMRGASCLHFACEVGHEENIRFLTNRGLRLSDETDVGQTCVDLAYYRGRMEALLRAAASHNILKLVDPSKRALHLPEKSSAQNLLASYSGEGALAIKTGASVKDVEMGGQRFAPQLMLLLRAFELDMPEMLRSLMVLGYLEGIQDAEFCKLVRLLQAQKSSTTSATNNDYMPFRDLDVRVLDLPDISMIEIALLTSRDGILTDLVLTSQLDFIPTCLAVLIEIEPIIHQKLGKHEQMSRLQASLITTLISVLDHLYLNADSRMKPLVLRYLRGEFWPERRNEDSLPETFGECGPRFPYRPLPHFSANDSVKGTNSDYLNSQHEYVTILELVNRLDNESLFASECLSQLTNELWRRREPLLWQLPTSDAQSTAGSCHSLGCSIRARYFSFFISYLIFLVYFAWYISDFGRTFTNAAPDALLWTYAAALTAHEISDIVATSQPKRLYIRKRQVAVPKYLRDFYNYCDLLALIFLWVGLAIKIHLVVNMSGNLYGCQVTLATSFLLWGFRTLRLIAYMKSIGPRVSMLQCLLVNDLGPFLAILVVIFVTFGVFYLVLLYPAVTQMGRLVADTAARPGWPSLRTILTFPNFLAHGIYQKSDLTTCIRTATADIEGTANLTCVHPDGQEAFNSAFVFAFFLLVNIVMWNLLIALFSLSVARLAGKTVIIWRKTSYDMLHQFRGVSFLPLPLSLIDYAIVRPFAALVALCNCKRRSACRVLPESESGQQKVDGKEWWHDKDSLDKYPEDYKKYLHYQALQLRLIRPKLHQHQHQHQQQQPQQPQQPQQQFPPGGEFGAFKAHVDAIFSESLRRDLIGEIAERLNSGLQNMGEVGAKSAIRHHATADNVGSSSSSSNSEIQTKLDSLEKQCHRQGKQMNKLSQQMKLLLDTVKQVQQTLQRQDFTESNA